MTIIPRTIGFLILPIIACGCNPVTPPNPPNFEMVNVQPAVATACGTVTWSLKFLKGSDDVTGTAWYTLNPGQATPVQAPNFTLTPSSHGISGYSVQVTNQVGSPLTSLDFANSIENTFTCTKTGQTIALVNPQVAGAGNTNLNYPNLTLNYTNGSLNATK